MNGLRRIIATALVGVAAPAVMALPVASVANASTCDSAVSAVNGYLDRHPDVNQSLTDINNENPGQVRDAYTTYFDNHPDVASEMRALKGPITSLNCTNELPSQIVNALAAL